MNYERIYTDLVNIARYVNGIPPDFSHRTKRPGLERHHIHPRSLGGADDADNLVYLTPRQHYIAHRLLVKFAPCNETIDTLWFMTHTKKDKRPVSSRQYATIKALKVASQTGRKDSAEVRAKKSAAQKGVPKSPEHVAIIKERSTRLGIPAGMMEAARTANKGRKQSPEEIAKRVAKTTGRKNTPEAIARMKAAYQKRIANGGA